MEANYTFNLSMEEFARIAGRSLATFKREFAAVYNASPGKWLTQKRLEYASLLLRTTNKNINEVAYACGFENATHFSRLFKARFGTTPSHFRETAKNPAGV